jgi:hypothetical protein
MHLKKSWAALGFLAFLTTLAFAAPAYVRAGCSNNECGEVDLRVKDKDGKPTSEIQIVQPIANLPQVIREKFKQYDGVKIKCGCPDADHGIDRYKVSISEKTVTAGNPPALSYIRSPKAGVSGETSGKKHELRFQLLEYNTEKCAYEVGNDHRVESFTTTDACTETPCPPEKK